MEGIPVEITTTGERNYTFQVEDREDGQGYLSPYGRESQHAIIMLQEWWGLNKSICETADLFAKTGFAVLIVDVYRGKVAKDREEAGHLKQGLDYGGAIKDIHAAAQDLQKKGYQSVGATGFCMGGGLLIASVCENSELSAAVPFYGIPDLSKYDIQNIQVPLLLHFGDQDEVKGTSDPQTAYQLQKALTESGVQFTFRMWNAGHAFMNRNNPKTFNKEVAEKALAQTITFFKENLN